MLVKYHILKVKWEFLRYMAFDRPRYYFARPPLNIIVLLSLETLSTELSERDHVAQVVRLSAEYHKILIIICRLDKKQWFEYRYEKLLQIIKRDNPYIIVSHRLQCQSSSHIQNHHIHYSTHVTIAQHLLSYFLINNFHSQCFLLRLLDMKHYLNASIINKGEGIILRRPKSFYEHGKSVHLMKAKVCSRQNAKNRTRTSSRKCCALHCFTEQPTVVVLSFAIDIRNKRYEQQLIYLIRTC